MTVYVGIDWGKETTAVVVGRDEQSVTRMTVCSRGAGVLQLLDTIRTVADGAPVVVVIEHGAASIARALYEAEFTVHVVDGKQLKRFRESLTSSGTSNDDLCAWGAWQMAQSPAHLKGPYQPLSGQDEVFMRTLKALDRVVKDITRASNQLRAALTEEVPELEAALARLTSAYARDLIRLVPTVWHAAHLTEAQWTEFVKGRGIRHAKRAGLWQAIQSAGSRNHRTFEDARDVAFLVGDALTQLDDLLRRERALETQLKALAARDEAATLATTMPGIGPRSAARLSVDAFSTEHQARAQRSHDPRDYAARRTLTAPVQDQTGTTRNRVHRRRGGSPAAGAAALRVAAQAVMRLPWAKAMYAHRRSRGDTHYTTLRKVGRSIVRILTAMIRTGLPYNDDLYVTRLKAKGVPWATTLAEPQARPE